MMNILLISIVGIYLLLRVVPVLYRQLKYASKYRGSRRMPDIFDSDYLECKAFYMYCFKTVPSNVWISGIDGTKAFEHIKDTVGERVVDIFQSNFFNKEEGKQLFDTTVFVLDNKVMIELSGGYLEILYTAATDAFADKLIRELSEFKALEKKRDFEINIIKFTKNGMELKPLAIKPTELDLGLYYNDDFKEIDNLIRKRLSNEQDKGIILLHGLPGTGKTTYLRHLIGDLKKKVLFVSPSVAGNLMNPEFIDLLIDNPNAVLVIEDAENILLDRKYNSDSSVSNLLNLSDGLLSDCLSVQIICTFNNALSMLDAALLRKGRLIAKYEFGKLGVEKAQALSRKLGFDTIIRKPMTLAEIANQHDLEHEEKRTEIIGFRRQLIEN